MSWTEFGDDYLGQPRGGFTPRYTPRVWTKEEIAAWLPPIADRLAWMGITTPTGSAWIDIMTPMDRETLRRFATRINHGPWGQVVRRRAEARRRRLWDLQVENDIDNLLGHVYPLRPGEGDRILFRWAEITRLEWT